MPLLVDGHNLIPRVSGLSLDDPKAVVRLVERLRSYHGRTRKKIIVFFDQGLPAGRSRPLSTSGVTVVFAPPRSDADAIIRQRLEKHANPREVTVVTSDIDLLRAAQARGAHTITADEFAQGLSLRAISAPTDDTGGLKERPLTPEEVDEMLRLFGEEPDEG